MPNVGWTVFVTVGIGLVLLLALWPLPARAVRLLERWGVAEPDEAERDQALTYLRRRRLVYPVLFLGVSALQPDPRETGGGLWVPVLVGLLVGAVLAELLAQRPRRDSRRAAALGPGGLTRLLSPWTIGTWAVLAVAALGVPLAALIGLPVAAGPAPGRLLALAAAAAASGAIVVWLAERRPPSRLGRTDDALRLRSARVGAGLSMGGLGATAAGWESLPGLLLALLGVVGWLATTARVRPPQVAARPG